MRKNAIITCLIGVALLCHEKKKDCAKIFLKETMRIAYVGTSISPTSFIVDGATMKVFAFVIFLKEMVFVLYVALSGIWVVFCCGGGGYAGSVFRDCVTC